MKIAGKDFPIDRLISVRIRASGQVVEMAPAAAAAMVNGGTAELAGQKGQPERAVNDPRKETGTSREQKPLPKKGRKK